MMKRFGAREPRGFGVRAEINVTSLVDVAFTLLIIFMITAPILQGGVEVEVPRAPAAPLTASEGLVVSVERDGQIHIDDAAVTLEEFRASIAQIVRRRGSPTVFIKGDTNVPYGVVLNILGTLNEAEVESVNLIAQPETER